MVVPDKNHAAHQDELPEAKMSFSAESASGKEKANPD